MIWLGYASCISLALGGYHGTGMEIMSYQRNLSLVCE